MKEKQFKGVWLKFIAVLVAVAMVIPLAFSGWSATRTYADDAVDNTGKPVKEIPIGHEFESGLKLDNTISTKNFLANGNTASGKSASVWVNGAEAVLVDYTPGQEENGMGNQYESWSNFRTYVTQQMWRSANTNTGGPINSIGVALGTENNVELKKRIEERKAEARAENDALNFNANKDKVEEYLNGRTDVPAAVRDTIINVLGGKLRILRHDVWLNDGNNKNWLIRDVDGNPYVINEDNPSTMYKIGLAYPNTSFYNMVSGETKINMGGFSGLNSTNSMLNGASGNEKVDTTNFDPVETTSDVCAAFQAINKYNEELTKNAVIDIVWHEIGTYDGLKVGMEAKVSNIQPVLDRRAVDAVRRGDYNFILTPAFQIAGLPQFGVQQHNANAADYEVKLFYIEEWTDSSKTEKRPLNDRDKYLKGGDIRDVNFTFSSLSTYDGGGGNRFINTDAEGNRVAPGEAGASYARSGVAINEMVKPLSPITKAYVTEKSNVSP